MKLNVMSDVAISDDALVAEDMAQWRDAVQFPA
jgi:hypothetical protein